MIDEQLIREEVQKFLLGGLSNPVEIVVVYKRHDEVESLIRELAVAGDKIDGMTQELYRMSTYAELYLRALDDLKECDKRLRDLGITLNLSSLRP